MPFTQSQSSFFFLLRLLEICLQLLVDWIRHDAPAPAARPAAHPVDAAHTPDANTPAAPCYQTITVDGRAVRLPAAAPAPATPLDFKIAAALGILDEASRNQAVGALHAACRAAPSQLIEPPTLDWLLRVIGGGQWPHPSWGLAAVGALTRYSPARARQFAGGMSVRFGCWLGVP